MNFLVGMLANRLRGMGTRISVLNSDDINAILFAGVFSSQWWHCFILYGVMRAGASTGWTEFLAGCEDRYILNPEEDLTWISKIIKIHNQFTCFLWGCIRASMWVICLNVGLAICGSFSWTIWLAMPLFYVCYKAGYLLSRRIGGDWMCYAEMLWGAVLWSLV